MWEEVGMNTEALGSWQELSAWGCTVVTRASLLQGGVSHGRSSAFESSRDAGSDRVRYPSGRRRAPVMVADSG